jgi:tight adherence protein B
MIGIVEKLPESLSPGIMPAMIFLLILIGMLGMLWVIADAYFGQRFALRRRLELASAVESRTPGPGGGALNEHRRKQSIEKALSEMARRERAKQRAKLTLRMRLNQADLSWTVTSFYVRAVLASIAAIGAARFGIGLPILAAIPVGGLAGFVALNFYVKSQRARRTRKFIEEFPNAIDIVTRGVKTGLPLGDCIKAIASEGQEPVKGEFRRIAEDLSIGLSMSQALIRFTQRVPIMEANFFAVVLSIQSDLGGNLSEALGNLSRVLRERKMMKQKIKAFSSEAKASGAIIAAMPVAVAGVLSLTSPDYIGLLYTEFTGNLVLAGCAVWMLTGVLVMRNMIRFDF